MTNGRLSTGLNFTDVLIKLKSALHVFGSRCKSAILRKFSLILTKPEFWNFHCSIADHHKYNCIHVSHFSLCFRILPWGSPDYSTPWNRCCAARPVSNRRNERPISTWTSSSTSPIPPRRTRRLRRARWRAATRRWRSADKRLVYNKNGPATAFLRTIQPQHYPRKTSAILKVVINVNTFVT